MKAELVVSLRDQVTHQDIELNNARVTAAQDLELWNVEKRKLETRIDEVWRPSKFAR